MRIKQQPRREGFFEVGCRKGHRKLPRRRGWTLIAGRLEGTSISRAEKVFFLGTKENLILQSMKENGWLPKALEQH